jgi:predicted Zn-dependent peptidase
MITFYLSTSPEQMDLAHRELQHQIRQIAEQGIPADVFENVRATVLSGLVLQQQSPGSIARLASIDLLFGLPATHHREVHQLITALQVDDVRAIAKALLQENKSVTAMVTPV